jgi:hypothetical protein
VSAEPQLCSTAVRPICAPRCLGSWAFSLTRGGDRDQRLGRGLEQDAVDHGLVVVGNVGDRRRQREDDVVVGHGQQLGLAIGQPFPRCRTLALRAVSIAARVIGNGCVGTRLTARDMAPTGQARGLKAHESCRAAALDG